MAEEWFVRQLEELSTSVDYETKAVLHETKKTFTGNFRTKSPITRRNRWRILESSKW